MEPWTAPSGNRGSILVVDDEPHQRLILGEALRSMGYDPVVCNSGVHVLEHLEAKPHDLLITDMQMPAMDGLKLLENALKVDPGISVIVVTAHGTVETAVEAMKKGAEDYLLKPIEFGELEVVLKRIFARRALVQENRKLQSENEALKRDIAIRYHLTNTIGKSVWAKKFLDDVRHYAGNREPILVIGERGVHKNDAARMIHYNSPWAYNDLIFFDATAVPDELQEGHLFGEEGTPGRAGLVEKAHMGTLVISHFFRLNSKCMARMRRLLAEGKSQRAGGQRFYQVNVRLIATCEKAEFDRAVQEAGTVQDMSFFFTGNRLELAPVRERKEDIPLLIAATAKRVAQSLGKSIEKIDRPVIDALSAYDFPGNNQELESLVESAVIRCADVVLQLEHFAFPGTMAFAASAVQQDAGSREVDPSRDKDAKGG